MPYWIKQGVKMGFSVDKNINCPQCGYSLSLYFAYAKIAQCKSCKSTIFLEDKGARLAGASSVLAPEISLIKLNQSFKYKSHNYLPLGMIRYSYGRGFWEEWWLKDDKGEEYWLCVDDGDMVLEKPIISTYNIYFFEKLTLNKSIRGGWVVSELGTATCEGFVGILPKIVKKGSTYQYAHLSGDKAKLRTIERIENNNLEVFEGVWISPFDIGKSS